MIMYHSIKRFFFFFVYTIIRIRLNTGEQQILQILQTFNTTDVITFRHIILKFYEVDMVIYAL